MAIVASWAGAGLADGTPVTTATAGTGDTAFAAAVTAGAFQVDVSGLHGPRIQADQAAATDAQLMWNTAVLGTLGPHAVRLYFELSALPGGNGRLLAAHDASNVLCWWLDVTSAGILRLRDPGGSAKDTSAAALPTGTEMRLEVVADGAGAVTATVYTGNGTTPWDVLAGTGFGTTFQQLRILNPSTSPTWPRLWLDEIAVANTAAEIGPVVTPVPEGGGTATAAFTASGAGTKVGVGGGTATAAFVASGVGEDITPTPPAFPDTPLKVNVELRIGDTWERVSGDVLTGDPVQIERGRPDEAGQVPASKLSLTLRNTAGKYSPRNPRSPYYGLIGRNTPIRVSVDHPDLPAAAPYAYMPGLEYNYLATADNAALDLTDVVDVRIEVTPDSWRPDVTTVLASKQDWNADDESWSLLLRSDGLLRFRWSADGATALSAVSTVPVPEDAGRLAVRAVFVGADTAQSGNRSCTFYTAPTIAGPWTQLGAVDVGSAPSSVYSGTADLEIGTGMGGTRGFFDTRVFHGRVHDFQLADGAGTVVADPGISTRPDTSGPDWTGPDGLSWIAYGSARILTGGPAHRFCGEVSEWPPHWSLGGHRQTIPIQAAGIKRRLGQGAAPVQSPLRRSIPSTSGIVAYWSMEDSGGAFASAYAGAPALRVISGGSTIGYGASTDFPGSAPLPTMGAGVAIAPVPAYPAGTASEVLMLLHMQSEPAGTRQILRIVTTGTVTRWDLWYSTTAHSLAMTGYDRAGNIAVPETIANVPADGIVQQVSVRLEEPSPGTVWMTVTGVPLGSDMTTQLTASGSGTVGKITSIEVGDDADLGDTVIGHIAISTSVFAGIFAFQPDALGRPGETAATRLARLCNENGVPLQIVGELAGTAAMGPQRVDTLLNLLEECADADGGILAEARDEAGLLYRARVSLYNQPATLELAYGAPGLAAPFEPTDDDQAVRNRVTVSREGGSSAVSEVTTGPLSIAAPPAGAGIYDESVTINVAADADLPHQAGWRTHLGTWDEARYPALGVKLHKAPGLLATAAGMDLGDRATVANLPAWLPPGPADALIQGYVETIELLRWRIDCNATPARPWDVAVVGDAHVDTGGSELATAVGADDTALTVATTDGPIWTLDPTDLPLTIVVGGEEMTVTAISGAASPQTFTVIRAVNGITKSHLAGADVRLARPPVAAL